MRDLLELFCEIRRCVDRVAGSNAAIRRVNKRWEKMYVVRARAIELYKQGPWAKQKRPRRALDTLEEVLAPYMKEVGLSTDRSRQTIYEWLLAYENRSKKGTAA
jgi:hypothetical protein